MRPASFGITEWFSPGEYRRVEQSLGRLDELGCTRLRTHLSWAEYHTKRGQEWYDWLIPTLAARIELLPCVHYTPPSLSETGRSNGPPRDLRSFADFIDHVLERYAGWFDAVELWNEPNNLLDWDWRADQDWLKYATMIGAAAHWARERGQKVVLGGPSPNDLRWLDLIGERGVLGVVDAIGLHGFPGTWDSEAVTWDGWPTLVDGVRRTLDRHNPAVEIWITETGYSTWRSDWSVQARRFLDALDAPAERVYWYALQDIAPDVAVQEGHRFDDRHYHVGLYDNSDGPKLLARILASGGTDAVRRVLDLARPAPAVIATRPVLVTGGAGFIGCNLADRLCAEEQHVLVLDSLARPGVEENLAWLKSRHGRRISVNLADIRDHDSVALAASEASAVFHLAAQVAVTSSMLDPIGDFETNARGTLNLLDTLRHLQSSPPLVFASTNKVYGDLADVRLTCNGGNAYAPENPALREFGIGEDRPIAFSTPYGCSKGCADQYVTDYAVNFGISATVFRMSCIYGPRQCGNEDQGWVAHFVKQAISGEPITIFGDGRQVRDILFVDDAITAYLAAWRTSTRPGARVFNLGGGPGNAVSLRDVVAHLALLLGRELDVHYEDWRPCDQKYYVSDTRGVSSALDMPDPLGWRDGVARLVEWLGGSKGARTSLRTATARTEVFL